jgi:hypothetical protein
MGTIVSEGVIADEFELWEQGAGLEGLVSHIIERKAQLLAAYQPYAEETRSLIRELPPHEPGDDSWPNRTIHPEHIADGSEATVFAHTFPMSKAIIRLYAFEGTASADIMEDGDTAAEKVNETMNNLIRSEGKPRFERANAASFFDGTVISKPVQGFETGANFTKDGLAHVTDEHLYDLRATLHPTLSGAFWVIDPSKVFFDNNEGFTILNPSVDTQLGLDVWAEIFSENRGRDEPLENLERRLTVLNRFARMCRDAYWPYNMTQWSRLQPIFAEGQRDLRQSIESARTRPADA